MKRTLLTTLLTLFAAAAFAQRGGVTATVVDADTGESVVGAVLTLTPVKTPEKKQYFTSAFKGAVSIPSLAYGEYSLSVAFLGYNNLDTTFRVSASKVSLGLLKLKPGVQIETVVKEAKALRTSQKGDTVSYNAGAFKVVADADVEGLLKKMPGITVTDGTVEAQGETVKKVFVDGKEFFGEDVTTAIKSLPAEAVDRVEVYNKLSDAAEFSGMDDGEGYKALNIVTRPGMRQGQFGKLYAGFGYDADTETEDKFKYIAGGNANVFSGDSRISFIGLFNNVNQQNFSFEDILGVSGATTPFGIKATHALLNQKEDYTHAVQMFFVINATSIQLIPASIISLRTSLGSANPSDILLPTILATLLSTVVGVLLMKVFRKRKKP